jgi:hypothetical protein
MDEKTNKKGILLFVAPIKRITILFEKTLLYYIPALVIGLLLGLLAHVKPSYYIMYFIVIQSLLLSYFSISMFIGVVARSFKELSFLGVFSVSMYSLIIFIPVFLINFSRASLASPLSSLVLILSNSQISFYDVLFSTLPHFLLSLGLFYVAYSLYHPETFFNYETITGKIISFYRITLKSGINYLISGFISVYFGYLIELLLVLFYVASQKKFMIYIVLFGSALIEEYIRNYPMYVDYLISSKHHKKQSIKQSIKQLTKQSNSRIALNSFLVALGFFLAEKLVLTISIDPFTRGFNLIYYTFLIIPLIVHFVLTYTYSLLVRRLKSHSLSALCTGIIHFAFNIAVFFILGLSLM